MAMVVDPGEKPFGHKDVRVPCWLYMLKKLEFSVSTNTSRIEKLFVVQSAVIAKRGLDGLPTKNGGA